MWCKHRLSLSGWCLPGRGTISLTANSGNKKLQKAVGVHINTNFRIGRYLIHSLDHIVISMKNVPLHHSVTIPYGFSASELSPGFDVHMHFLYFHQCWINRHRDRGGIVHRRSSRTE